MLSEKELIDGQRWLACWEKVTSKPMTARETFFARAIEAAACAERDKRIAELALQLEESNKDSERWKFLSEHIGVAWGEEGFTSLVRIVSEKHRALINEQIDDLMAGKRPSTSAAMKGTP